MVFSSLLGCSLSLFFQVGGASPQQISYRSIDIQNQYLSLTFRIQGQDADYLLETDTTYTINFVDSSNVFYPLFYVSPVSNNQQYPRSWSQDLNYYNYDSYNLYITSTFDSYAYDHAYGSSSHTIYHSTMSSLASNLMPLTLHYLSYDAEYDSRQNNYLDLTVSIYLMDEVDYAKLTGNVANTYYDLGYSNGYDIGYTKGYDDGVIDQSGSITDAYDDGYVTGRTDGYQEGYDTALETHDFSFTNLFASLSDTPILIIRRLFGFEIFGVGLISIFMSLFTALIVIHLIKKVF